MGKDLKNHRVDGFHCVLMMACTAYWYIHTHTHTHYGFSDTEKLKLNITFSVCTNLV